LPNLPIFYEEDHLIFGHDAMRMYRGDALYKDFFQLTFPGTHLLYLALLNIFGPKFWIINAVVFLHAISQTIVCFLIAKRLFDNRWYALLPPCLFLFFGFRWFAIEGTHRMLSPIFIWLAIYVLLKTRSLSRIAVAGVLCALSSYFTQQRGVYAVAAIAIFLLWEAYRNSCKWKDWLIAEIVLGASFVVSLGLLILPYLISAGAETFFNYTFFFLRNYVQDTKINFYQTYLVSAELILSMGVLISIVMFFYYALIPLVYLIVFGYVWRKKDDISVKNKANIVLVCLIGLFLALGTFAPNPTRLFQTGVPALIAFVWLLRQINFKSDLPIRLAVIGLMIFGAFLALRLQTNWDKLILESRTGKIVFFSDVVMERYQWLLENTEENEYVFEAYYCTVYFPLLLRNPTSVPYLANTGYSPQWHVDTALENLKIKQPRLILWDAVWNKELETIEEGENLLPVYEYLQQNYKPKRSFTPYGNRQLEVWERK
jgi:hypothetical protein